MFKKGFEKTAIAPLKVDPITARDAAGATKAMPFSKPIGTFGQHPRMGVKAKSRVGHAGGYGT